LKHISAEAFCKGLHKYLRAIGYFQKDLAEKLGLHPKVLSRKLHGHGNAHLTEQDVRRIILALAQWQVITTQDEALHLLELAQMNSGSFTTQEWQTPPLSQLTGRNSTHHASTDYTSSRSRQHNLPAPLTRLVGREEPVKQLRQLLGLDDVRLVTLVGSGGSGKTRLALHMANEMIGEFAHGVWFVDLTAVHDPALVTQTIMQELHIKPTPIMPALQSLTRYLQNKQLLLLLDNFEQVAAAAAVVGELLAAAPGLKVLVTSRMVLHLYGESEFKVPPLDIPISGTALDAAKLAQYGAVQLFAERARAVVPDFTLTAENAASTAQICARVDGLPLALELAAARVKVLPPAQLLARLSKARLSVLTRGASNLPGRQQTLRKTFTWSFNLLSPSEQIWFARLGVFSGGWSLEAAEEMMQALGIDQRQEQENLSISSSTLDLLEHLVDNSLLVRMPETAGQARFTLLETLREYALERLNERGELECLRDWHTCYYLKVAEEAELGLRGAQQLVWHTKLLAERDNFRAALEWSLQRATTVTTAMISDPGHFKHEPTAENGAAKGVRGTASLLLRPSEKVPAVEVLAVEVSLRLAAALRPHWEWQGHLVEGRGWLDAALAAPLAEASGTTALAARAKALSEAARLVCLQNEQDTAVALAEASIALWRQLDDPEGLATALLYRGWPATALGDNELAKCVYEQGLQLLSPTDNVWLRAQLLFYMGAAEGFTYHFAQMRSYYAQSRELFEQIGDKSALADVIKDQGGMAILEGNYTEAITNLLKSIELSHELGYKQFIATAIGLLGFAVGLRGEPDPISASLQTAQLWGAKDNLMDNIGSNSWLRNSPIVQEIIRQIQSRVDEASWQAAWLTGQLLTEEQAVAACLALKT
jgi:predicted ATPase